MKFESPVMPNGKNISFSNLQSYHKYLLRMTDQFRVFLAYVIRVAFAQQIAELPSREAPETPFLIFLIQDAPVETDFPVGTTPQTSVD